MSTQSVAIAGAPTYSVRALTAPNLYEQTSSILRYEVTWQLPNGVTESDYKYRWQYLVPMWYITISLNNVGTKKATEYTYAVNTIANATRSVTYDTGKSTLTIDLSMFYPNVCPKAKNPINKNWNSYLTIKKIVCKVFALNTYDFDGSNKVFKNRPKSYKSDMAYLEQAHKCTTTTLNMVGPANPQIPNAISLDTDTGILTALVKRGSSISSRPCTRTKFYISRQDNYNKTYNKYVDLPDSSGKTERVSSAEEFYINYNFSEMQSIQRGQWARIKFSAVSVGPTGSALTAVNPTYRTYIFAYPPYSQITSITASDVLASGQVSAYAQLYIKIKTNASGTRPIDSITLQRLANTTANTAQKAGLESGWEDIASDDAACAGFVDTDMAGAMPDPGNYTWYRLKTVKGVITLYGSCFHAKVLYRSKPTAADDSVSIVDAYPSDDGKRIIVYVTWDNDDSTGNEFWWGTAYWKWYSTESKSTWSGQWKESATTRQNLIDKYGASKIKQNVMGFSIADVEPGSVYYIRVRRYRTDADGTTTYSPFSYLRNADNSLRGVFCTTKPTSVRLFPASSNIVLGNDLVVTWSANTVSAIKYWQVVGIKSKTVGGVQKDYETVLATGTTNVTYATIPAATLKTFAAKDMTLYLGVRIHTGGTMSALGKATVKVVNKPTLTITSDIKSKDGVPVITAQPLKVKAKTNDTAANIIVKIIAYGVTTEFPDGVYVQNSNEVIWSGSGKSPTANEYTTITVPPTVKLIDGAKYKLEVVAANKSTGLSSDVRTFDFTCSWARKVPAPSPNITIKTPYMGMSSYKSVYATFNLVAPTGWQDSDRYDIYRVTPDGIVLYGKGFPGNSTANDLWAPFTASGYDSKSINKADAKLVYRIVARSTNGDMKWIDVPYNIKRNCLRLDWRIPGIAWHVQNDTYLELPYNLTINDSYKKDFEKRKHLGGRYQGYWNDGVDRTRTISTGVVRLKNADQIAKIRELARHTGPVFVRTPDGCAFEANVEVNDMTNQYNTPVMDVSLDISEIELTRDFGHTSYWAASIV